MNELQRMFDLSGRRALVTGASSGLGRHFAATLAHAGAAVVMVARRTDKLEQAVIALQSQGGRAYATKMDVSDRASVTGGLDQAAELLGGTVDLVINNAGTTDTKRALDYSDEDWDHIVGTNLKGSWMVAQEAARRMVENKCRGSIVNITSILANRVAGGVTPYCASKAGLKHLTQAFALEWARYGIRVNSLAPGYVATDFNQDFLASEAGEKLKSRIPMRRFGDMHNLDGALLLLSSEAGAYMTGCEIVVDGGHLCTGI
jgi:NAD(P)-dependent dehydrogenase (short-subunit alcohol dehydrogenase family)